MNELITALIPWITIPSVAVGMAALFLPRKNILWHTLGIKNTNDEYPWQISKKVDDEKAVYVIGIPDGIDMTALMEGTRSNLLRQTFGNGHYTTMEALDGHRLCITVYSGKLPDLCQFQLQELLQGSTSPLHIPIGQSIKGTVYLDIGDNAPHIGIAGTNGSGKSTTLRAILLWLVMHPVPVEIYLCDLKEGVEGKLFERCARVKEFVKEPGDMQRILKHLVGEMKKRLVLFYDAGCMSIDQYNAKTSTHMPRIFLVMDEFADLEEYPEALDLLTELGRKARAAGIHTIPATQRPSSKVMTGAYKANVPCWLAFRVRSYHDSMVIIDHGGAELLRGKGHCIADLPGVGEVEMQGFYISPDDCERILEEAHKYVDKQPSTMIDTSGVLA